MKLDFMAKFAMLISDSLNQSSVSQVLISMGRIRYCFENGAKVQIDKDCCEK